MFIQYLVMGNIKSKLQNFLKIKDSKLFKSVIGWVITSLYSVFFMFVLLGIVLGLCIYYYNSIQMVQPTVKQMRIESSENISWFQFDVFQNASESLEDNINAGVGFSFRYEPKDVIDSIYNYQDVKKKDSVWFYEERRGVQLRNGYGTLSLLNKEEIPEGIDSTMNYKRHLIFEMNEKTIKEFEKIDAHVFPDKENRVLIDSCSKNKVFVSYYNDVCKDDPYEFNGFHVFFRESFLSTNNENPYIYCNIQFKGFGNPSQGTLKIGYKDYKNDDWDGFVSNPLKYEYIYPEPSWITSNNIVFTDEKIKEVLTSGITIHAVDMTKKMHSEKIVFLHTVLFGMCLTYVIQIITYLIGLWRDKILRDGYNGVTSQKQKLLIFTAFAIIIIAFLVSFI